MFNKLDYKRWEIVLLVLTLIFFTASVFAYLSELSIQSHLFGMSYDESQPIGKISINKGNIQRELNDNSGFNLIQDGAKLYNFDTILSNSEGSATIQLSDGGVIELTPNTMFRLTLENHLDSDGLYRAYHVEVFNGQVSAKAKKTKFILKNKENLIFVSKGENKEIISKKKVNEEPVSFKTKYVLKNGSIISSFPTLILPPMPSLAPKLIPITKKTEPTPKPTIKVVVLKPVPIPSKIPEPIKKPVNDPRMFVEVPFINYPPNESYYSKKAIESTYEKRILLTWSRKKYLDNFDIEIATDIDFNHLIIAKRLSSNFYSFTNPPIGNYWWRIRSLATDSRSGFTLKRSFSIKP